MVSFITSNRVRKTGAVFCTIITTLLAASTAAAGSERSPAPIYFKGAQATINQPAATSKPTFSTPYAAPALPQNTAPMQFTPQYTAPAQPSFDPRKVDQELYAHQQIGQPYTIDGQRYVPAHDPAYDATGIASWYGPSFHGKVTANGETYDMNGLTAAHKTLPMNSLVYVTNLDTGQTLTVRINDRGPFIDGRIIDLSRGAAKALGIKGLGNVRVQYAGPADPMDARSAIAQKPAPQFTAPAPVKPEPKVAELAPQQPSYKPLSVEPFSYAPKSVAAPAPALPSQPLVQSPAPTGPTIAPQNLLPKPVGGKKNRPAQSFDAPADGGVMTLTITGPIHVAKDDGKSGAVLIPAVYKGESPKTGDRAAIGVHYVQAATFSSQARAQSVSSNLSAIGETMIEERNSNGRTLYRVIVGPFDSDAQARKAQSLVMTYGFDDARILTMH